MSSRAINRRGLASGTESYRGGRALFGHPRGLTFLFLTGMWEVAALFGMRTILVIYLVDRLHYAAAEALSIYGWSSALSFSTSLICAPIADRYLGLRRAVFVGALALAVAHFMLILPALLIPSLVLIAIGAGFFRPSLVGQVWLLYDPADSRRGRALVLYKLGCNLGGILGPVVCGLLFESYGWTTAVLFCGAGMLVSILIFALGRRVLPRDAPGAHAASHSAREASEQPNIAPLRRTLLLVAVGIGGTLHWAAANQQGGTMALWVFESLNRTVELAGHTFTIPAAWFQSLNPVLILLMTPVLTFAWSRRGESRGIEVRRMAGGSLLLAGAYLVLFAAVGLSQHARVSWLWPLVAMVPFTLGELYLDPMGQAFFSRLAPRGLLSTSLSLWFLTQAAGYVLAGQLGSVWAQLTPGPYFLLCAGVALSSAVAIAATHRIGGEWRAPGGALRDRNS